MIPYETRDAIKRHRVQSAHNLCALLAAVREVGAIRSTTGELQPNEHLIDMAITLSYANSAVVASSVTNQVVGLRDKALTFSKLERRPIHDWIMMRSSRETWFMYRGLDIQFLERVVTEEEALQALRSIPSMINDGQDHEYIFGLLNHLERCRHRRLLEGGCEMVRYGDCYLGNRLGSFDLASLNGGFGGDSLSHLLLRTSDGNVYLILQPEADKEDKTVLLDATTRERATLLPEWVAAAEAKLDTGLTYEYTRTGKKMTKTTTAIEEIVALNYNLQYTEARLADMPIATIIQECCLMAGLHGLPRE